MSQDPLEPNPVDAPGTSAGVSGEASLVVRAADTSDAGDIERFVEARAGSVFQGPAWGRAVQRVFGHRQRDLVAHSGRDLVGVLPLMQCSGLLGGSHLISTPYGVYGGPLSDRPQTSKALVAGALELAESLGVGRLELRLREECEHEGLVTSDRYVTFIKDLPEDPGEVLKSMKKDERRLVRRAADTHGLVFAEGSCFLEDLVKLFHSSKRRLGSPGLPLAWFRALLEELGERAPIHIVRRQGRILAASMSFVDGEDLRMYYIGTTPEANRCFAATSFMIAELQNWGIEQGLRRFDLGRSRRDAGAVKFKTNQGFQAQPLHYSYGLVKSRELPSFTPSNPRTALLRKSWSCLPQWLCSRLSTRLSRFLP